MTARVCHCGVIERGHGSQHEFVSTAEPCAAWCAATCPERRRLTCYAHAPSGRYQCTLDAGHADDHCAEGDGCAAYWPRVAPRLDVLVTIYAEREDLIPTRGSKHSTGLDLRASETAIVRPGRVRQIPTGVTIHVDAPSSVRTLDLQVRGRSGLATKGYIVHVGTVDLDYRGPLDVIMYNATREDLCIRQGDRIAQLIVPTVAGFGALSSGISTHVEFAIGVAPVDTERGASGYGSTGK